MYCTRRWIPAWSPADKSTDWSTLTKKDDRYYSHHTTKEVQWVTSLANENTRLKRIVAGASLEKGEQIKPFLEELSANTLVKGVRRLIESEADIEFCLQPNFI
jgi:hypothetical protein